MGGAFDQANQLRHAREAMRRGDYDAAGRTLLALHRAQPSNRDLWHPLGVCLSRAGNHAEAVRLLTKASERQWSAELAFDLAWAHVGLSKVDEASATLRRALDQWPGESRLLRALAELARLGGGASDAEQRTRDALAAANPAGIDANLLLARALAGLAAKDARAAADEIEPLLAGARFDDEPLRMHLGFVLAELYDAAGDFDRAFAAAVDANALKGARFDPDANRALIDRVISSWTVEAIAAFPRVGARSDLPIFVVGMPRSGTTLIEQILASHPRVAGAGELNDVTRIAAELGAERGGGAWMLAAPPTDASTRLSVHASAYISRLRAMDGAALRVTDKMPTNGLHLGLIALAFPRARIVHCTRSPIDTCVSCFMHDFTGDLPFVYHLAHLGAFHHEYSRLLAHWRRVIPNPVFEASYEAFVADPEGSSRRLIEFAGLEWTDACLRFHESRRLARTASIAQVRRPVYATSVERWRRYESRLGPLITALGPELAGETARPPAPPRDSCA